MLLSLRRGAGGEGAAYRDPLPADDGTSGSTEAHGLRLCGLFLSPSLWKRGSLGGKMPPMEPPADNLTEVLWCRRLSRSCLLVVQGARLGAEVQAGTPCTNNFLCDKSAPQSAAGYQPLVHVLAAAAAGILLDWLWPLPPQMWVDFGGGRVDGLGSRRFGPAEKFPLPPWERGRG